MREDMRLVAVEVIDDLIVERKRQVFDRCNAVVIVPADQNIDRRRDCPDPPDAGA